MGKLFVNCLLLHKKLLVILLRSHLDLRSQWGSLPLQVLCYNDTYSCGQNATRLAQQLKLLANSEKRPQALDAQRLRALLTVSLGFKPVGKNLLLI